MIEDNYLIMFGDLSDAKAPGYSKAINKEGVPVIKIRLKPTDFTKRKYNIKDTDQPPDGYFPDGYIHKEYDEIYLLSEINEEGNQGIFLDCDFEGKETEFTKKIETIWKQNALYWRSAHNKLKIKIARLQYDLKQAYESIEQMEAPVDRRYLAKKKILGTEIINQNPNMDAP